MTKVLKPTPTILLVSCVARRKRNAPSTTLSTLAAIWWMSASPFTSMQSKFCTCCSEPLSNTHWTALPSRRIIAKQLARIEELPTSTTITTGALRYRCGCASPVMSSAYARCCLRLRCVNTKAADASVAAASTAGATSFILFFFRSLESWFLVSFVIEAEAHTVRKFMQLRRKMLWLTSKMQVTSK